MLLFSLLSRRRFVGAALVAAFTLTIGSALPARAEAASDAKAFIEGLADTAMKTVAVQGIAEQERQERFRSLFVDTFDLPEIGKLVLGRYWRTATPEQQQDFLKLFEDIQVYTWSRRFQDYGGETLEVLGVSPDGDTDSIVESRIKRQAGDPISVSWRVRKEGEIFKVMDIKVEGASMAFTHRSEYSSVIQGSGGKVDGLLAAMRKKIAQLQANPGQTN